MRALCLPVAILDHVHLQLATPGVLIALCCSISQKIYPTNFRGALGSHILAELGSFLASLTRINNTGAR